MFRICLNILILCLSFVAMAQESVKIDADIYAAFNDVTKADAKVRIIVHIAPPAVFKQDATPEEIAVNVIDVQNDFLIDLRGENLLKDSDEMPQGFEPIMMLDHQYAIAGYLTEKGTLEYLANRDDVVYLEHDRLNKLYTVQGRQLTGSDAVAASGYTGNNIGVAVIDSEFDLLHPELGGSTSLPNSVVKAGYNYSNNSSQIHSRNFNDCYHGTGTASIVRRYATDADIYALVVFPNAYNSTIANAINWCVTNRNGVNGGAPIKIISMSLGGGQYSSTCNSGVVHSASGSALSNGILVFAASGNDGWTNSMGSPACSSNVIAIGSVWDATNANYSPFPPAYCNDSNRLVDERTCYSNISSQLDLYAPSEEVMCARCGGGTFPLGGTSSATPAAAGMTAQLLDKDGSLAGNKSAVLNLYNSTGASVIGDSSRKRINLSAAVGGGGGGTCTPYSDTVTGISASSGNWVNYTQSVPSCATSLTVKTSGGSGDADLYVRHGANPTTSNYDCRPYRWGNNETCTFSNPASGTWYIRLRAYSTFSNVTLDVDYN